MGMQRDGVVGTGDERDDAGGIAHFGDGASSQGDVNESFIRGLHNAPVVFFCQNNQWAISEPIERPPDPDPASTRGLAPGPGVRVDGNDNWRRTPSPRPPLNRARDGQGPTSSRPTPTGWARTPRPTTDPRYRLSDDLERWKLKDPDRPRRFTCAATASPTTTLLRPSSRRPTTSAAGLRGLQGAARPAAAEHLRPRPPRSPTSWSPSATASRRTSASFEGGSERAKGANNQSSAGDPERSEDAACRRSRSPRASTWGCARRWRMTPKVLLMGEDVGKLGGVFRITDGLQKDSARTASSTRRWPSSASSAPRSARRCAATAPVVEIQFDGFVTRPRPDRLPGREDPVPARAS